jgi:Uncharacterized ACR, COG1430
MRSGWLLRDGDVVCALQMTDSVAERWRGRSGGGTEGGLHLCGARWVHTALATAPVDVAYLNADLVVLHLTRLSPWRVCLPRRGVRSVVTAEAGLWERLSVRVGDQFEIREVQ